MSTERRRVLPRNVRPTHYHLALTPDLEKATFAADVTIDVAIAQPTDTFVLNSVGLLFRETSVKAGGSDGAHESSAEAQAEEAPLVQSVTESVGEQRITIVTNRPIAAAAQLQFSYTSSISDDLFAFYRSAYTFGGQRRTVAATQLCPAEARRVFPCWDEPSVKATFALDITVAAGTLVWSNDLPAAQVKVSEGLVRWEFRPAFAMSTYLLAWVVGDLESTTVTVARSLLASPTHPSEKAETNEALPPAHTDATMLVRAVTPRGKVAQAAFALSVAAKVLPLYEDYFRHRYVFPKLDLVALPNFAFGAMENWGCVTFRERTMLVPPDASPAQREVVATVVAHELAHQWFGNLATMDWWSDLWLNESFATYMATWAVHQIFPEWVVDTQFVYDEGSRAFTLDALRSSHPIELPVQDVGELDGIFDAISYSKGAMVLRMTAKFIGEEGFRRGLVEYISRYAFSTATSLQLWECLSSADGPNVKDMLQSWTKEQGYPYVQVTQDIAAHTMTLTQHRFLVMDDARPEEDAVLWHIPMYYTYGTLGGAVKTQPLLLTDRTATLPLDPEATWVKVNSDQVAFCRVHYTADMLRSLVAAVTSHAINGTDRYSLMADLAALAYGGYCGTVPALQLMAHYHAEDDYTVWCEVARFEKKLRNLLFDSSAAVLNAFNAYCGRLYKPAMQRLGMLSQKEDSYRVQQTRRLLFQRLLACGDAEALALARDLHRRQGESPIPTDLLSSVCAVHIREHGTAAVAEVKQQATETDSAEVRANLLASLAAVPDPATNVRDIVEFLLSGAVPSQDVAAGLQSLAESANTFKFFVQAMMETWPQLRAKVPPLMLARILKFVEYGADKDMVDPLQVFFAGLSPELQARTRMTFQQGLEGLRCNAAWADRDVSNIGHYLLHPAD